MPNQQAAPAGVPAIEASGLTVRFPVRGGVFGKVKDYFTAVDGVSFTLEQGKTLSVVGESGCGKSTLVKSLVGLVPLASGSVKIFGRGVQCGKIAPEGGEKPARVCDVVQMVFQDPFSSLNPRQTVEEILTAPLVARKVAFEKARQRAVELLERVSIPHGAMEKFPHEFSGGQRQRLCIARSLMVEPKVLLCDEVTSALDVSVQAQILNLLKRLQRERGITWILIGHDLAVMRHMADDLLVMQKGREVEKGLAAQVLEAPQADYTRELLSAVPDVERALSERA